MMHPRNMLYRALMILGLSLGCGYIAYDTARWARGDTGIRIVDGDTFTIDGERIRIFGLDCDELRMPNGPAAKHALTAILQGKRIELKRRELDRFGRTIAAVYANGRDVACELIRTKACNRYAKYDRNGEYIKCEPRQ